MSIRHALLLTALALCGCDPNKQKAVASMEVVAAYPEVSGRLGTRQSPMPLHLNSNVQVSFSSDIDRLSVTSDTVRMVKITDEGEQTVRMARRQVGRRTVTLIPDWPLTADLDDGSYLPDQLYRLEIPGFPRTNTVRSKAGIGSTSFVRYYRTVSRDAVDPGPLLPLGTPYDPFIVANRPLRMAAGARTVRLRLSLPPNPTTVTPDAFACYVLRGEKNQRLRIASIRVLSERYPVPGLPSSEQWPYPASTVELTFGDETELRPGEPFWVHLQPPAPDGSSGRDHLVRDYRGRPITLDGRDSYIGGNISSGDLVELLGYPPIRSGSHTLIPVDEDRMTFEVVEGRVRVLARVEAGAGRAQAFRPVRDTVLQPMAPFYRGPGVLSPAVPRFEFSSIHIPVGVTVTLRSAHDCELLSANDVRIDGTLLLDTPYPAPPDGMNTVDSDGYHLRLARSPKDYGARLVAAGEITVRGEIRRLQAGKRPPLVVRGRDLNLEGVIPRGTIVAAAVHGSAQGIEFVKCPLQPGLPAGAHRVEAAAWTPWLKLPADFSGSIDARAEGIRGDLEVLVQLAPPDPVDVNLPYVDRALAEPLRLPLRSYPDVGRGWHVRFLLRANVVEGKALPQVRRLLVLAR